MSDSEGCRLRKDPDKNGIEEHKPDKIFRPDKPIHKPSESLLTEFNGFSESLVWFALLLLAAIISLLLETIRSSSLFNVQQWLNYLIGSQTGSLESSTIYALLYLCVPAIVSLFLEKGLAKNKIPQKIGMIAHILNMCQLFILPGVVIYCNYSTLSAGMFYFNKIPRKIGMIAHILNICQLLILPGVVIYCNYSTFSAVGSIYIYVFYVIQVLKIWSYVHVNYWCRVARNSSDAGLIKQNGLNFSQTRKDKDSLVEYPDNLVFKDLAYYFFAPTVCYELNFPRTNGIRKRFLIRRLLEVIIIAFLQLFLYDWMTETIRTALTTNTDDLLTKIELHLKVFVRIQLNIWAFFYIFFHSYLNMWAELMYFADRTFYQDWWNASTGRMFWKKWNVPIHRWFLRHIYLPLRDMGYTRKVSLWAVFLTSGLFHEYLISALLKISACVFLIAFMTEVPFIDFSEWIEKHCGSKYAAVTVGIFMYTKMHFVIFAYYYKYVMTHYEQPDIDSNATI